jgi:hypothetical protein
MGVTCLRGENVNRSADFQTCRVADFQIGAGCEVLRPAGLETRDTTGLETGAPAAVPSCARVSKFLQFGLFKPRRFWHFTRTSFAENARTGEAHGQSKHEESTVDFMGQ